MFSSQTYMSLNFLWPKEASIYPFHHSSSFERAGLRSYRSFCLSYYIFVALLTIIISDEDNSFIYPFFFMTFWGHLGCLTYFALVTYMESYIDPQSPPSEGVLWKFAAILFEVVFSLEVSIPALYWVVLAPYSFKVIDERPDASIMYFLNISVHALTPIFLWIELAVTYVPFIWTHCIFLPIIILCYSIVNAFGVFVLEMQIYQPVVNWITLESYIYIGLATFVTFIGFGIGLMIQNRKYKKHSYFNQKFLDTEARKDSPELHQAHAKLASSAPYPINLARN